MDQNTFDELEHTLQSAGPAAAVERLCGRLREQKDYANLFYALLLKKRHELGVLPVPSGPTPDMSEADQAAYEQAIREAGRLVGNLYLDEGNIPYAWVYYRMLAEPGPVARALERHKPAEGEDVQPLVQIAFFEGVHPKRGFDLIVERFGVCNAITTMSNPEFPHPHEVRVYCIERLVHALNAELDERIRADIERRDQPAPPAGATLPELLAGRDYLFDEQYAHVDTSHLAAVVQMSTHLPPGRELQMARWFCDYGRKLPSGLQYTGDPPFENQYEDYGVYLAALAGENVEEAIAHFRAKAEKADPEEVGTYPAEVLVRLLVRLNRPAEALDTARRFLAGVDGRRLTCPTIPELCQQAKDFRALAETARQSGDAVHFLAGLLAAGKN